MTTIEFSLIPDSDADFENLFRIVSDFEQATSIEVKLNRMEWENAWQHLIGIATQGHGADVSHVGSRWVSSLMVMNALRPIPNHLVDRIGGERAFVHSTWTGMVSEEDRHVYGIPLGTYVYVIAYRKDLLQQAGLHERSAFATPAALEETIRRLAALNAVKNAFLIPVVPFPFNDLVHMGALWIWASGGHILDNRGKQVLLDSPAALAGLKSFLSLLRNVPNTGDLGQDQCMEALLAGKAAAGITNSRALLTAIQNKTPNIGNVGAASLMSIPWTGGGSVVVWRHTHGYPDRLEASYKLVEYLSRKQTMLELAETSQTLPSRTDALNTLFPPEHPMRAVMLQLVSTGRSYRPVSLWHRIEHQFGMELGAVANELMQNPKADLDETVTRAMTSVADRLNLTLG